MKVQRVKVYLSNGEVADIKLLTNNVNKWIDAVSVNGIKTKDQYIPHHSITYILIEDPEEEEVEVEVEFQDPDEPEGDGVINERHYQTELD
jgi:hypothetical protein